MIKVRPYRYMLLVSVGLSSLSAASAQEDAPPPTSISQPAAAAGKDGDGADIVVTGSRVAQRGFASPTPVTEVGREALNIVAPASIGEALVRLPAFRDSSSNQQAGRFATGSTFGLDLRGLGSQRTLVLVDGRRWTPTTQGGTVDTTLIPQSLVERIDVVTGGASSAYGSDAVAGVVNFVLRDKWKGVSGNAQYGISEEGDAEERIFSLAAGIEGMDGRLHVTVGGDYGDQENIGTIYTRDWSRDEQWLVSYGPNRAANLPAVGFASNVTYGRMTSGSIVTSGPLALTAFGPGGTPFQFNSGTVYSNVMIGGSNPNTNPAGNYFLLQPNKRFAGLGRATFDVSDDLSLFVEANYGYHRTNGFITWLATPSFTVSINNPFIPAATRAEMVRLGLTSLTMGRVNKDLEGGRRFRDEYRTHRFSAGGKGRLFDAVDWDANISHGSSRQFSQVPGDVAVPNLLASFYAVTGPNGQPVCGPVETNPNLTAAQRLIVQPGCVPFNVFGDGSRSQAAADYVLDNPLMDATIRQDSGAINLRAKPFSTWAGKVSIAAGFEARRERVVLTSDPLSELNAHTINNFHAYRGARTVKEGYVEALVPLASDTAWARSLTLDAAVRFTNYSTSGTVTTWKVSGTYDTPFGLLLRGTRSRDIRAPSIADLFSAQVFGSGLNGGRNPFNGQTGSVFSVSGGNPDLVPEVANTKTVGLVYQPRWLPRFGISVDYYDINLKQVITTPAIADILSRCQQGVQEFCDLIVTDNTAFGIAFVRRMPVNLAARRVKGFDAEVNYRLPGTMISSAFPGDFNLRVLASHTGTLSFTDAAGTVERAGSGVVGVPTWTWNADFGYRSQIFSANLNARWFNRLKYDSTLIGPEDPGYSPTLTNSVSQNRFPGAVYFNLSASVNVINRGTRQLQFYGTINNLLDRDPAKYSLVAFATGGNPYTVLGRSYRIGARFNY